MATFTLFMCLPQIKKKMSSLKFYQFTCSSISCPSFVLSLHHLQLEGEYWGSCACCWLVKLTKLGCYYVYSYCCLSGLKFLFYFVWLRLKSSMWELGYSLLILSYVSFVRFFLVFCPLLFSVCYMGILSVIMHFEIEMIMNIAFSHYLWISWIHK